MNKRLIALRRNLNQFDGMSVFVEKQLFYMTIARIDKAIGRGARLDFLRWAFHDPLILSSNDLMDTQKHGILMWARPHKPPGATKQSPWLYAPQMFEDLELFQVEIMKQEKFDEDD